MSRLSKIAASTLTLAMLAAPAFAGEVFVFDQWNQPVMVQGAKGAGQATTKGHFIIGVPRSTTNGGNIAELLQGNEHWVRQPEIAGQPARFSSDYLN